MLVESSSKTASIVMTAAYIPFISLCNYFNISWESLGTLSLLLFIDYVTGISKTYVIDKRAIKSYRATAGIISKVSVLLVPISLSIASRHLGYDMLPFVNTVISMLVLAELYSIIGNVRAIQTGKETEEIDAVSFVLGKINSIVETLLKKGR